MSLPVDLSPKGETNTTLKGKDVAFIAFKIVIIDYNSDIC